MRLSARHRLLTCIGGTLFGALAVGAHAQSVQMPSSAVPRVYWNLVSTVSNETGVTVGALRHPLRAGVLTQIDASTHRAPQPGVELELLAPGDVGITVHMRW